MKGAKRLSVHVALVAALSLTSAAWGAETVIPTNWTPVTGSWPITNTDTRLSNTNAYAEVAQGGKSLRYEWTVHFQSTTFSLGPAAGLHFLADNATDSNRGNSYLVFQDASFIRVYKAGSGTLTKVADLPMTVAVGETHTYRVDFNTESGLMVIFRDGVKAGEWTDPSPLQSGKYISLRTNGTTATFANISVTTE